MSTRAKRSIVLFEDDRKIADDLQRQIRPYLKRDFDFKIFPLHQDPTSAKGPYEDRLVLALKDKSFGDIVLLVTDRDLSAANWGGLSEVAVASAAATLGLPVACYRQFKPQPEIDLQRIPGDGKIELPADAKDRASRIVTIAKGFVDLEKLLVDTQVPQKPPNKGKSKSAKAGGVAASPIQRSAAALTTPGALMARVLGQPDVATHFDLFACGDQRAIAEILKGQKPDGDALDHVTRRRVVVAMGVWLADLVMAYPGLLVNEVAAASYLDIHKNDFSKAEVRQLFESARYVKMPFADDGQPMWWRHLLDNLLNSAAAVTGRDLCNERGLKRIRFCPCSVDKKLHAGYYCMDRNEPLSEEESAGRVSWFPVGADLARLSKQTYRALAPWMGS